MSTAAVVNDLGYIFPKQGYDWNVWDMQLYKDRIYIGYGNSRNEGPSPNAGPITIMYLDTNTNKIVPNFVTDEEQVENFRILDNRLYVPGTDIRSPVEQGNIYATQNDTWLRIGIIPGANHVFDLELMNGKLFAAISTSGVGPTVFVSEDMGKTWKPVVVQAGSPYVSKMSRTYSLFNFKGNIYAATFLYNMSNVGEYNRILVTDGVTAKTVKVTENSMFPGAPKGVMYRLMRPTVALDCIMYISGIFDLDYQWKPEGIYFAPEINQARRIKLPEAEAQPMDILSRGDTVYVLANKKVTDKSYINVVYKTNNLSNWSEVLRFENDTFARSFEEAKGTFYFGMGCDSSFIANSTGKIVKVSI